MDVSKNDENQNQDFFAGNYKFQFNRSLQVLKNN